MMDSLSTRRRVERVRHELRHREVQVRRVEALGAGFVRVVFGGDALDGFVSLGFDDHVKFLFDGPGGEPVRRDYTPRRFDAARRELTIDFARHGHGAASAWASGAAPGQRAAIAGPRGSMIVDPGHDWHLLVGDASAAPAIARRLAELPAAAQVLAVVQLDDLAVLELDRCAARLQLRRVADADALVAAVQALVLPAGEGYAWAAGEAATMGRVRAALLARGQPAPAMRVAAYWKRGAPDYHADLDA